VLRTILYEPRTYRYLLRPREHYARLSEARGESEGEERSCGLDVAALHVEDRGLVLERHLPRGVEAGE